MNSKKIITFAFVIAAVSACFSQNDPKAKKILDELSAKTKAYSTVKADFEFTVEKKDKTKTTQKGKLTTKGTKYKLEIPGHDIYCDGKTVWDHIKDASEVQVKDMETGTEEDAVNPSTIFTLYEKGYKYKFDKEDAKTQTISLFPLSPDKKKFHTVKLFINKAKNEISSVVMNMKDGSSHTYLIKTFVSNSTIADADFSFNAKTHPGVSVEDLR